MFRNRKKVLTALMLCITMIITMIPAAAFAEDEVVKYQLYIGGKQVTSAYMSNSEEGWKYEPTGDNEGTLTLRDANITGRYQHPHGSSGSSVIYSQSINLTVKLEGTNNVLKNESTHYINGISAYYGTLTITGDAKLSITVSQYAIFNDSGLTIDNADITAHCGDDCIILDSGATENIINKSKINLTSEPISGIDWAEGGSGIRCYPLTINETDLTIKANGYGIEGYEVSINESKVKIHSGGDPALNSSRGHNIVINNSEAEITADADDAIYATSGDITIVDSNVIAKTGLLSHYALRTQSGGNIIVRSNGGSKQTRVEATTKNASHPSIFASGSILLGEDIDIVTPENGKIGDYSSESYSGKAVVNEDGLTPANHVILKGAARHTVTYRYTGDVPEGAPAVPESAVYKAGDSVTVAAAPRLDGYTFSGWSKTGSFDMPDEDVEITGSWIKDPAPEPEPQPAPEVKPDVTPAPAAALGVPSIRTQASSPKKMIVQWKEVDGATGYVVAYRKAGTGKWSTKTVTDTKVTLKKMKAGKLYQYRVAAKNSSKTGSYSKVSYRFYRSVKGLKVKAKKNAARVTWKKAKGAKGYIIEISDNKNFDGCRKITVKGGNKKKYTIKGLEKGQTYYVKIRPYKTSGGNTYMGILSSPKKVKVK